jgi:hypothetical protein
MPRCKGVQEGGFPRIVSFAMMHINEEALKEDDRNPFIFVKVIMMCSCYDGVTSGWRR